MLVIGMTGGIGSGKTTVAKLFEERGVPIIDSDVISRQVVQTDKKILKKITSHFGEHILTDAGMLDRAKLRRIVFEKPLEREWLEKLLHPIIRTRIEQKLALVSAPYCIVIIPLLFETAPYPFIDRILVIDTPEHVQIERAVTRDQMSKEQISTILKNQATREVRLKGAHDVILNSGSMADLLPQVEKLHNRYSNLSS